MFNVCKPLFVIFVYDTWQSSYDDMVANGLVNLTKQGLSDIDYLKEQFEEDAYLILLQLTVY